MMEVADLETLDLAVGLIERGSLEGLLFLSGSPNGTQTWRDFYDMLVYNPGIRVARGTGLQAHGRAIGVIDDRRYPWWNSGRPQDFVEVKVRRD